MNKTTQEAFKNYYKFRDAHTHKESTKYKKHLHSNINNYKDGKVKMMINNNFTKDDLKTGDVIVKKDNDVEIVCLETGTLIRKEGYNNLSDIKSDLTYIYSNENYNYNIIKVYRPHESYQCCFDYEYYIEGELVYDRNEVNNYIEENKKDDYIKKINDELDRIDEHLSGDTFSYNDMTFNKGCRAALNYALNEYKKGKNK